MFKSKQDKAELCPLLVTYPLELVHMDFLTIENPGTGTDVNILVIMDQFTWYIKAVVSTNQSAKATVAAFWNEFIANYGFSEKLLTNQLCNFESQLVKELCKLAWIQKVRMTPYCPETNGQCERFNQTPISMADMLEIKDKQHWKDYLPMLVHAHNCTKNNVTDFSPYHLMYGCKPQLPINIQFSLTSPQSEEHSHNKFLPKFSAWLWWCYELPEQHQCKESTCQSDGMIAKWGPPGLSLVTSVWSNRKHFGVNTR